MESVRTVELGSARNPSHHSPPKSKIKKLNLKHIMPLARGNRRRISPNARKKLKDVTIIYNQC